MQLSYEKAAKRRAFWTNLALAVPTVSLNMFILSYEDCDAACADWDYVDDLLLDNGQNRRFTGGAMRPRSARGTGTRKKSRWFRAPWAS